MNADEIAELVDELMAERLTDVKAQLADVKRMLEDVRQQQDALVQELDEHKADHTHAGFEREDEDKLLKRRLDEIEDDLDEIGQRFKRARIEYVRMDTKEEEEKGNVAV